MTEIKDIWQSPSAMRFTFSRTQGFGRFGCFGLILMIALLWGGGQKLYVAFRNTEPTTMSYEEYLKTKPKAEWLVLTNCVLNLPDSSYLKSKTSDEPKMLYIPVYTGKKSDDKKVHVILATKDENMLATMKEMMQQKSPTAALTWISKNLDRCFVKKEISGVVQFGIDQKDSERKKLTNLQGDLASDFIIIKDGEKPEFIISGLMFAGGVLLFIGFLSNVFSSKKDSIDDSGDED